MAALAVAAVAALIVLSAVKVTLPSVFRLGSADMLTRMSMQGARWGLAPDWSWAMANGVFTGIGILAASPLFRWISGTGWKCRCNMLHLFVGASLVIALSVSLGVAQLNGFVSSFEADAMKISLLLTFGFCWHAYAQKRAEARYEADAEKAEIDTFA